MDDQDLTAASNADFVSFTSCLPDCHPGHPFIRAIQVQTMDQDAAGNGKIVLTRITQMYR